MNDTINEDAVRSENHCIPWDKYFPIDIELRFTNKKKDTYILINKDRYSPSYKPTITLSKYQTRS